MFWKAHGVLVLGLALYAHAKGHATSEQNLKQEFVLHHGHHGELNHIGSHSPGHHDEYATAYPSYEFSYKVNDPHTHDHKGQHEERHGDEVKGEYWLLQPDGKIRTVKYHADKHKGFRAHVHYSKHHGHIEQPRIEEPRVEEPRVEEPRIEEPRLEEPHIEEPRVEEPRVEEPRVEEPREEEPRVEEPRVEEPRVEEPRVEEPRVEEPREEEQGGEMPREEVSREEEPREEPRVEEPRIEGPRIEEIIKPVIEIIEEEPSRSVEQNNEPVIEEVPKQEEVVKAEERNDRHPEPKHHRPQKPIHIEYYINHKYRHSHEKHARGEIRPADGTAGENGIVDRNQERGEPRREMKHRKPVHVEYYSKIHHEIHGHREETQNRRSEQGRDEERGIEEQRGRQEERGREEQHDGKEERGHEEQRGREEERRHNEVNSRKEHHSHNKHEREEFLPILLRPFNIGRHHELTEHRKPVEHKPIRFEERSDKLHEPHIQLQRMHKPIILTEHAHRHRHQRG